jgi:hypothetical protein
VAKNREPALTLDEYIKKLRESECPELSELCEEHGIDLVDGSAYELLRALSAHAEQCDCPTLVLAENYFPFEAQLIYRGGTETAPHASFCFDGKQAVIVLDKPFIMPNLETLVEVLFYIAYKDSYFNLHMISGDEISVGELFANDLTDEVEIDGLLWGRRKPFGKDAIEKYAFAGDAYVIIGGSGSPGADYSGGSALCQFHSHIWLFTSDPGEWYDLGEITREQAIEVHKRDNEYLRLHPEQYEYSDWAS